MLEHYNHPGYAQALHGYGLPFHLEKSGGWVSVRQIPDTSETDVMGMYPFQVCKDWSKLPTDLEEIRKTNVSMAMVTDPFGTFDLVLLEELFTDTFRTYKDHYVVDLRLSMEKIGGKRRRQHARRALNKLEIEVIDNPVEMIDDWMSVYQVLIDKHSITDIRAFSRDSFVEQFRIPGVSMLRATKDQETVAAQVYFYQGDVVHAHLGACTQKGYQLEATYALDWFSFDHFRDKANYLNLGGGVGVNAAGSDGLSHYKQLWATETRPTYFCGLIFNRERYEQLVRQKHSPETNYFPAYRVGEFA